LGRWGTEGFARLQDNASPASEFNPDTVQAVLTSVPLPAPEVGTQTASTSAVQLLDLYNEKLVDDGTLIGEVFNSFDMNVVVIAALNVMFYVLIYVSLKKKDSI
jgi:hypothetical protein